MGLFCTNRSNTSPSMAASLMAKVKKAYRTQYRHTLTPLVHRPTVAYPIVNTVRNEHAIGPTGKIMIEGTKGLRTAHATGPKQLAQMLFRFGVNRKIGIPSSFIFRDECSNPLELRIAIRRVTAGEVFRNLA